MSNRITAVLIGAGQRGAQVYSTYALKHPDQFKVVAVAEPDAARRGEFAHAHQIPKQMQFESWEQLLAQPKLADAAMICTQDKMHYLPTKAAMEKGYHVLCEKPMSTDPKECLEMGGLVQKYGRTLTVCYVLRYTPFFMKIKELLDSGVIGQLVCMQYIESVEYWHQAHSFVRGNWRNSKETSPMILAKSCHDMDMLLWLIEKPCKRVSSFGSLTHFKPENAPEGAAKRCCDCSIKETCPYNAQKIYFNDKAWYSEVIQKVVSLDTSKAAISKALETGNYGRCVYAGDNDVVDHQVVNLLFEDDITVSFTMCAFTLGGGRTLNIMGSRGQIKANMETNEIEVADFLTGTKSIHELDADIKGHGGGDDGFMQDFLDNVKKDNINSLSSAEKSVMSHIIALASEESRITGKTIEINDFISRIKGK